MSKTRQRTPSRAQAEVLRLLAQGWEAGQQDGYGAGSWMQSNGIGRGGESRTLHATTLTVLLDAGWIRQVSGPMENPARFRITDKGRASLPRETPR